MAAGHFYGGRKEESKKISEVETPAKVESPPNSTPVSSLSAAANPAKVGIVGKEKKEALNALISVREDNACGFLHCLAIGLMENIKEGKLILDSKAHSEFLTQFGQSILSAKNVNRAATPEQVCQWVREKYSSRYSFDTYQVLSEKALLMLLGGRLREHWKPILVPKIIAKLKGLYDSSVDEKIVGSAEEKNLMQLKIFQEKLRKSENLNIRDFEKILINKLIKHKNELPMEEILKAWLALDLTRDLYIEKIINKGYISKDLELHLLGEYFRINILVEQANNQEELISVFPESEARTHFVYDGRYFYYKSYSVVSERPEMERDSGSSAKIESKRPEGVWFHLSEVSDYVSKEMSNFIDLSQYHKNMKLYYQWLRAAQGVHGKKVTEIQYWKKGRTDLTTFHHLSLRTYIENEVGEKILEGIYASYWPGICASEAERNKNKPRPCKESTDHFHDIHTDRKIYGQEPEKVKLYTVDVDLINAIFYSISAIKIYWKWTGSVYVNPFATYSYEGMVTHLALQNGKNPALMLGLCIALSRYSFNCTGIVKLLLDAAKVPAKLGFDNIKFFLGRFHEHHNMNPPGVFAATPIGIFELVKELSVLEAQFL